MSREFRLVFFVCALLAGAPLAAQEPNVHYMYDQMGQLIGAVDESGTVKAYRYDGAGRLVSIERLTPRDAVDILMLDPSWGPRTDPPRDGALVTIYGVGFSEMLDENLVTFNGMPAGVLSATATMIRTRVPPGATTGRVRVTTPDRMATSRTDFTVTNACA